jgi:DNA primase
MKSTKKNQYVCLCPFHNDKNPSFGVNDEKGLYHCFSCGAKGNTIGFVMAIEQMTYKEAVAKILSATDVNVSALNIPAAPSK